MKLAVSNIAWTHEEEKEVAPLLQHLGVKYVEVAPTKKWEDPTKAPSAEIAAYKKFWQTYGIEIVAFQSMLFNRPDLKLFESEPNRQATLQYLKDFIRLAHALGARVMVFGSPKNRQKGDMDNNVAAAVAQKFFAELGDKGQAEKVVFCIEPNPTVYSCDFVTNAAEGIQLVERVQNPGFGLHLDLAGMTLAGDSIEDSIKNAQQWLKHFHISSPYLEQVEAREDVNHELAAQSLRAINYQGFVSIEMKPGDAGTNMDRVKKAVLFAQSLYV